MAFVDEDLMQLSLLPKDILFNIFSILIVNDAAEIIQVLCGYENLKNNIIPKCTAVFGCGLALTCKSMHLAAINYKKYIEESPHSIHDNFPIYTAADQSIQNKISNIPSKLKTSRYEINIKKVIFVKNNFISLLYQKVNFDKRNFNVNVPAAIMNLNFQRTILGEESMIFRIRNLKGGSMEIIVNCCKYPKRYTGITIRTVRYFCNTLTGKYLVFDQSCNTIRTNTVKKTFKDLEEFTKITFAKIENTYLSPYCCSISKMIYNFSTIFPLSFLIIDIIENLLLDVKTARLQSNII